MLLARLAKAVLRQLVWSCCYGRKCYGDVADAVPADASSGIEFIDSVASDAVAGAVAGATAEPGVGLAGGLLPEQHLSSSTTCVACCRAGTILAS